MWIRSQNKRIISNVDEVLVTFVDENKCFISGFWGTGSDTLGVYSTKEKAFAVLDEIQEKIEYPYPSKTMPVFGTNGYHLIEKSNFYQMPQDDEVEI